MHNFNNAVAAYFAELHHDASPRTVDTAIEAIGLLDRATPGAPLALVIPPTAVAGPAQPASNQQTWASFRRDVARHCRQVVVATAATYQMEPDALSGNTLLSAVKVADSDPADGGILFVNALSEPPAQAQLRALAQRIRQVPPTLEHGATVSWMAAGMLPAGHATMVRDAATQPWRHARILDPATLAFAESLHAGRVAGLNLPMVPMQELAEVTTRAFDSPTRVAFFNKQARWTNASTLSKVIELTNQNDQRHAAVLPYDPEHVGPLNAWFNSVMGIIAFWYTANRYHNGRSYLNLNQVKSLPAPHLGVLNGAVIPELAKIDQNTAYHRFLPIAQAGRDPERMQASRNLLRALGADPRALDEVQRQVSSWCLEPTVQGNFAATSEHADTISQLQAVADVTSSAESGGITSILSSASRLFRRPARVR